MCPFMTTEIFKFPNEHLQIVASQMCRIFWITGAPPLEKRHSISIDDAGDDPNC